ncbi:MAG: Rpn family recombination-promoting nuclease/putative transposase [Clostridiales bacterium]
MEHKSYRDSIVGIQMLEYIIEIWRLKMKRNKVPLVIPLLIYHGKEKWNIDRSLINLTKGLNELPESILKYIPNYEYIPYNMPKLEREDYKGH